MRKVKRSNKRFISIINLKLNSNIHVMVSFLSFINYERNEVLFEEYMGNFIETLSNIIPRRKLKLLEYNIKN